MRMDQDQRKSYLRLLRLPDDVLDAIDEAGLSAHAASALARLGDAGTQRRLLAEANARGAGRAVAQAAAAVADDPELPPGEAVDRALRLHREADAARARSLRDQGRPGIAGDAVEAFARSAKALIRELDRTAPTTFQAGTIRLLCDEVDRKSTRLNSSHVKISYAVFCLKKKKKKKKNQTHLNKQKQININK